MTHDRGRLQAYLDGELSAAERTELDQHLQVCQACQEELRILRRRAQTTSASLAALDPQAGTVPLPVQALTRLQAVATTPAEFQASLAPANGGFWQAVKRRFATMTQSNANGGIWRRLSPPRRLAVVGTLALLIVVTLFSIAPTRDAMAQFLGMFRVRKFAVVPVDKAQIERLESLEDILEASSLADPTYLREPGDPEPVADVAEAEARAGFDVRMPAEMPEGSALQEIATVVGPHVRLDLERSTMEMVVGALGLSDVTLPPVDRVTLEVDVPVAVAQEYTVDNPYGERDARFAISQAPSPAVDVPAGIDPDAMGELFLRMLGTPAEDAQRLARSIDWTSTLVLPFPADAGSFYEIEVDGSPAILLEGNTGHDGYRRTKLLLWERDGIVYAVEGENVSSATMKQIADSLR